MRKHSIQKIILSLVMLLPAALLGTLTYNGYEAGQFGGYHAAITLWAIAVIFSSYMYVASDIDKCDCGG